MWVQRPVSGRSPRVSGRRDGLWAPARPTPGAARESGALQWVCPALRRHREGGSWRRSGGVVGAHMARAQPSPQAWRVKHVFPPPQRLPGAGRHRRRGQVPELHGRRRGLRGPPAPGRRAPLPAPVLHCEWVLPGPGGPWWGRGAARSHLRPRGRLGWSRAVFEAG